jgi:hypothetical protein
MTGRHHGATYRGIELEITQARDLANHLKHHLEFDRARGDRSRTVDDDLDGVLKLADGLGDVLDRALARMVALDLRIVHLLALDLNATSYRSLDSKRIIKIFGDGNAISPAEVDRVSVDIMGLTLDTCLTAGLRSIKYEREAVGQLRASFDKALVCSLITRWADFEISLDRMPKKVQVLRAALARTDTGPSGFPGMWSCAVAERFAQTAMPIFSRTRRLDRQTASILRLTSLSLAAETYAYKGNELSDICWELAAGVTLLEQRVCGEDPPQETIMLARA